MLREYLQYKILEALYDIPEASKLFFIGGTALRIVHGTARFSEDLDFDTMDLSYDSFVYFSKKIRQQLESQGFNVEIKNLKKGAYHCYIRFPQILFDNALSPFLEEKILIQLDTEPQGFYYKADSILINKFDVLSRISVAPVDILLSQKISAALLRKRPKGRDFYDIVFLFGKTSPNYDLLEDKFGISSISQLRAHLLERCQGLDFEELTRDVSPFLFFEKDRKSIKFFHEFVKSLN